MDFHVMTLFPEMIHAGLNHSMIRRGMDDGIIRLNCVNIRDFSNQKHKQVDDYPYGGGVGMVMQPQPIYDAYQSLNQKAPVIFMSPQGKTLTQAMAQELAEEEEIIILCGHYEGVDERIIEEIVTLEISIGDYILTGGELAAMVLIDAVARLLPGVLGKEESFQDESFSNGLLEYPQYTRPLEFLDKKVPEVLLSGHHKNVADWRKLKSLERTLEKRPELLDRVKLSLEEKRILDQLMQQE